MARLKFNQLFREYPDGTVEPIELLKVGEVLIAPGVRFGKGATFAGIDFLLFRDHDFEVRKIDGQIIIERIYQ